ncbi:hypothetical protein DERF_003266 [Dermatophagoides farinae]|uniref:Uncharacterized protein n=1 Tax=Dermatophagoides farinae TaxID=6954 RepID=A0A922IGJ3_DERFA|nr:hypothetical protein DERF_003266 [Dermatophagoides farinae]
MITAEVDLNNIDNVNEPIEYDETCSLLLHRAESSSSSSSTTTTNIHPNQLLSNKLAIHSDVKCDLSFDSYNKTTATKISSSQQDLLLSSSSSFNSMVTTGRSPFDPITSIKNIIITMKLSSTATTSSSSSSSSSITSSSMKSTSATPHHSIVFHKNVIIRKSILAQNAKMPKSTITLPIIIMVLLTTLLTTTIQSSSARQATNKTCPNFLFNTSNLYVLVPEGLRLTHYNDLKLDQLLLPSFSSNH